MKLEQRCDAVVCQMLMSRRRSQHLLLPLQGQTIPIRIHMSTAHWGRFELRLCPLSDPSLVSNRSTLRVYMLRLAVLKALSISKFDA